MALAPDRLACGSFNWRKMAYKLQPLSLRTQERTGEGSMEYTHKKDERKSNSKSTMVQRLLMLSMITMSLMFSGVSATSITKASAPCDMVCTNYIDPADGQCYTRCCPADDLCKIRCVLMPCDK